MKKQNNIFTIPKGLLIALLLLTTSLVAEEYTKTDRVNDMLTMAAGMQKIQKGLMYRCEDGKCIKDGIKNIKDVLHNIEKVDPKDFLDKEQANAHKFAKKTRAMLEMYLDEIEVELRHDNADEVLHNYSLALRQCTSCHLRLRK